MDHGHATFTEGLERTWNARPPSSVRSDLRVARARVEDEDRLWGLLCVVLETVLEK